MAGEAGHSLADYLSEYLASPRRRSPRPMPMKIPAGAHVLSHSDLRAVARRFANTDDPVVGEELLPWILHHKLLDAPTGRIIPHEVLNDLGEGDAIAGRKVLRRFIELIREHKYAAE